MTMASIIITGGNAGIGYYMTKQFLEDGHCVAVLDVNTDKLEALERDFSEALVVCTGDASEEADVARCVTKAKGLWGGVDIAVHNACVCVFAPFDKTTETDLKRVHDVNFGGAVNMARWTLPAMKRQKSGRLCFVSSGVGVTGFEGLSAYASSKGAIEALARCLDLECDGTGVSVCLLHPPLTRTASSSPLPVPPQMMADPEKVGRSLARRISDRGFIIGHSAGQRLMTRLTYLFPRRMGRFLCHMTRRAQEENKKSLAVGPSKDSSSKSKRSTAANIERHRSTDS
jgi:NAD(P)-dependent dehydrogenase (short-subunit alcohol dehydrogenase family)